MENKRTRTQRELYGKGSETQILDQIVDAILEVAVDLQAASPEEWGHILAGSCRRRKHSTQLTAALTG